MASWRNVSALNPISPYGNKQSVAFDIRRNGDQIAGGDDVSVNGIRTSASDQRSYPYGVNDAGSLVGWVDYAVSSFCYDTVTYWPSASSNNPVDLGLSPPMPSGQGNDVSRGYAINSLQYPQVVGLNKSDNVAYLWEMDSSQDWSVTNLNDEDVIPDCSRSVWTIREAHDINDAGWIVAWGERTVEFVTERHALLLTPVPACPIDTNQDGCIDRVDYDAVLSNWGDCPMGSICYADVDLNCTVNIDDLVSGVIYYWCECPCSSPCSDGFQSSGSGSLPIEDLIIAVLESGIPSADQAAIIAYLSSL